MLKLRITEGSNAGKEIAVNSSKFLIGRADECNLRPHSDAISRRHCVIIVTDKAVGVRDLKSRNGTVVNGEKIVGDKRLRHGDVLSVGPLSFEVIIKSKAEKPAKEDKKKRAATANAAAEGKGGEIGGMVSQWLEEADEFAKEEQRLVAPETREYRFDDTSSIAVDATADVGDESKADTEPSDDSVSKQEKKKDTGKLPKFEVKKDQPKDTQEAASQVLRKLFNRG